MPFRKNEVTHYTIYNYVNEYNKSNHEKKNEIFKKTLTLRSNDKNYTDNIISFQ